MCHDDNRFTLPVKITENLHNLETGLAIQIARGLVTEENFGIVNQGPCNGYTLLLTTGQTGWDGGHSYLYRSPRPLDIPQLFQ